MATRKSTEYTSATDGTGTKNAPTTWNGVTYRYARFTGTALSASDVVQIMTIPSGVRILPQSMAIISDLESSATVNVGYAAHTTQSSGAAVAIDADAFISAVAADSATPDSSKVRSLECFRQGRWLRGCLFSLLRDHGSCC